uniref:Uncharacterized protein n=1 Tax=Manihot esculenta TaxID=3983 RepID=A0A2C9VTT2_MANES
MYQVEFSAAGQMGACVLPNASYSMQYIFPLFTATNCYSYSCTGTWSSSYPRTITSSNKAAIKHSCVRCHYNKHMFHRIVCNHLNKKSLKFRAAAKHANYS